ncbi:hypothetical protein PC9H_003070 [Pleurotus ostreatus]|uniref:Galactose-binding like protein n=1 Tax=Pleurotus ostreatus TaxID=5322 RepID=A0A8H7A1N3_PLEOS|nr:uncharacterized protein PC9H_003070 [Pleurotus ostreatus]KAF7436241.1 hypothetical protein PC9H_003070 [Pleurotus ostreatus]
MTDSNSLVSLITKETKVKVSSDKGGAKKCLIDQSPETCWTSQQALRFMSLPRSQLTFWYTQELPQYIQLLFADPAIPKRLSFIFQGGFVGTQCAVYTTPHRPDPPLTKLDWQFLTNIYPEDVNRKQTFDLPPIPSSDAQGIAGMKFVFEKSSDFFGRITIYDLSLEGIIGTTE